MISCWYCLQLLFLFCQWMNWATLFGRAMGPVTLLRIFIAYELRIEISFIRNSTHYTRPLRISFVFCTFFVSLCTLACSHFGPVRMRVFGCTKLCCVCAFAQVICCKYAAHRSSAEQVRFAFVGNTRLICNDTLISHHVLDLYIACLHRTYNARWTNS